ncbi:response regulator [Rheinheimera riviphila]|uniref:response regulator n=1 Tax=Rheinheimera riviphila TaxID=1834037 RepID=UPI0013E40328|nr:response regulator [Rheinheimera riviphila]
MTQLKLDLAKLFDLQVLVIESDQDLLHLIKQMLHSLGIKKLTSKSNVEELLNSKEKLSYDVIFLDYQIEEQRSGAEIVEALIMAGILPNRTRLVLLAAENDRARHAIEYPYHQIEYLSRPFNIKQLDAELKQHVMSGVWLKPILSLAGLGRYNDALKLLLHTRQQPISDDLQQLLLKLKIQLLLDMDKHETVVPLLKTPVAEMQGWALWALFRIRYERGDIAACEAFLQDGSEELAKYAERREIWQIYLAIQQLDYDKALQVAVKIPNVGMSMKMVRLVHMVLILAGKTEQAIEFIERKRRLAGKGLLFLQLSIAQARSLLLLLTLNQDPLKKPVLLIQLKQLLQQIEDDKDVTQIAAAVLLIRTHLMKFEQGVDSAQLYLLQQQQQLQVPEMSVSMLCHAAVVYAGLEQPERAFDFLFEANKVFDQMLDNSARVFAGCLHRHAFDFIISPQHRAAAYATMAQRHQQQQDFKLAAKMYQAAAKMAPDQPDYLQQLHLLMRQLGLRKFRGITLPATQL